MATVDYNYYANDTFMPETLEYALSIITAMREAMKANDPLVDFKKFVVKGTLEYPAGCMQGKVDFLETIDLEDYITPKQLQLTVVINVDRGFVGIISDLQAEIREFVTDNSDNIQDVNYTGDAEWITE